MPSTTIPTRCRCVTRVGAAPRAALTTIPHSAFAHFAARRSGSQQEAGGLANVVLSLRLNFAAAIRVFCGAVRLAR